MTQLCVNNCGRPRDPSMNVCCLYCRSGWHLNDCDIRSIRSMPPDAVWRTGCSGGRALYVQAGAEPDGGDPQIGSMLTPELAAQVVRDRRRAAAHDKLNALAYDIVYALECASSTDEARPFRIKLAEIDKEMA